jgi:MSHA biogenesis protein MshJ
MKKWWITQSARVDKLSLRERVFLFLSVLVCVVGLVDTLWLGPARLEHSQLSQQLTRQSAELQHLRTELTLLPAPVDPSAALSVELTLVNGRLEVLDKNIKEMTVTSRDMTPLAQALAHFLRRYDNITLVRTATLAAAPAPAAAATGAAIAPAAPVLVRQGMELTVSGSYADLIRMVQTLETAMPTLRWGELHLQAATQPPQLTLQVFVIGDQP